MDLVDALYFENTYKSSWSVSIKGTDNFIPKPMDEYGFNKPTGESYWNSRNKPFNNEIKDINGDLPF